MISRFLFGNLLFVQLSNRGEEYWVSKDAVTVQGRCTRQFARIANKNVKSPLNLPRDDQSIVENATQSIGDISHSRLFEQTFSYILFFLLFLVKSYIDYSPKRALSRDILGI